MRDDQREYDLDDEDQANKRIRVRCLANLLSHSHGTTLPSSDLDHFDPALQDSVSILGQSAACQDLPPALIHRTQSPLSEASKQLDSSIKNAYKEWKAAGGKKEEKQSAATPWSCYCPHPGEARQSDGDACVVLLSDKDSISGVWSPLLPLLKAQRFQAVHCSGLGGTEQDVRKVEEEAQTLAQKTGTMKPLSLVALGGAILPALSLAARKPGLVKRLVLACPRMPDQRTLLAEGAADSFAESPLRQGQGRGIAPEVIDLLRAVSQPTLALSADDDTSQKTSILLASHMDDCRYFDLGAKAYPLENSDPTTFLNIVSDFLHEESDDVPFPFMRK